MKVLSILMLALLTGSAVASEEAPDTFGQRGDWSVLLAREDVRGELKLSEKQQKEIDVLIGKGEAEKALRKSVAKVVSADQLQRLRELGWQAAEGYALLDDAVGKELAFTAEQREALAAARSMNAAQHAEMKDFLARARFRSAEAMNAYIEEFRSAASGRLLAVLTEKQAEKLKKLCGKPFEFGKA